MCAIPTAVRAWKVTFMVCSVGWCARPRPQSRSRRCREVHRRDRLERPTRKRPTFRPTWTVARPLILVQNSRMRRSPSAPARLFTRAVTLQIRLRLCRLLDFGDCLWGRRNEVDFGICAAFERLGFLTFASAVA